MKRTIRTYVRSQSGFTLVEVVIASAIGLMLMTALTSVILTSVRAANIATSRVEASGQIRNFEFFASDDFAHGSVPPTSGCGTVDNPCDTQPIVLTGTQASNSVTPITASYQVSYTWDGSAFLDRQVGTTVTHMARNVTGFSWYVDTSSVHPTVVISLTVTIQTSSQQSYSQSQAWRFYPRVNP